MPAKKLYELPPCPDPDKYVLVKTKEGCYWRRKRGTIKPARLNTSFSNNILYRRIAAAAATRITGKLQPFLADLQTRRLHTRILGALIKSIIDCGIPDYRYLNQEDLQHHPINRLLRGAVYISKTEHEIKVKIPIDDSTVDKKGKLVTGYYFEAISLYGDMTIENGIRIDSVISPLYSFERQPETECLLTLSVPPNTHPWMILLKASCQEKDRPSVSGRHFGLMIVMVGLPPKDELFTTTAPATGQVSGLFNRPVSLPDQLPDRLPDHLPLLSDQLAPLPDQLPGSVQLPDPLSDQLPDILQSMISALGKRLNDKEKMNKVILALCAWHPQTLQQLSELVQRNKKYLLELFIIPLREKGLLAYTIPDSPNHPEQAYRVVE